MEFKNYKNANPTILIFLNNIYKNILLKSCIIILIFITKSNTVFTQIRNDSSDYFTKNEDQIIDEIIKSGPINSKEKVQKTKQITQQGFKNLFNKLEYNIAEPYRNQIDPHAEAYMKDYLQKNKAELLKMKGWAAPYFNLIDGVLSQYGLPRELKYVAVIESHLNPRTTSWTGAAGPWQFMPLTGREFGLIINNSIDERRDYYKSTHAAARYLLTLYRQLKDWLLVLAAYNGGPSRVINAIKKSGSTNFWQLQNYLPQESKNYVKKFITTHYIIESGAYQSNFIQSINSKAPFDNIENTKEISVHKNQPKPYKIGNPKVIKINYNNNDIERLSINGKFISLVIAKNLMMDINQFVQLNPQFDEQIAIKGIYEIQLPVLKMELFRVNKNQILSECAQILISGNGYQIPEENKVNTKPIKSLLRKKKNPTKRFGAPL